MAPIPKIWSYVVPFLHTLCVQRTVDRVFSILRIYIQSLNTKYLHHPNGMIEALRNCTVLVVCGLSPLWNPHKATNSSLSHNCTIGFWSAGRWRGGAMKMGRCCCDDDAIAQWCNDDDAMIRQCNGDDAVTRR